MEARDRLDVAGAEQRLPLDDDAAELALAIGLDRQGECGAVRSVVDLDVELAEVRKGEAASAELRLQRLPGLVHLAGIDRVVRAKREGRAQGLCLGARLLDPGKRDRREAVERTRFRGEGHMDLTPGGGRSG